MKELGADKRPTNNYNKISTSLGSRFSKPTTKVVVGIIGIASLWMLSGLIFKSHKHEPHNKPRAADSAFYKIQESEAQVRKHYLKLNGVTFAKERAKLTAKVDGAVAKIIANSGTFLHKGDPILKIELKDRQERVANAEFALQGAERKYNAAKDLYEKGLTSKLNMEEALSSLERSKADLALAKFNLDNSIMRAPYNGYIDEILVKEGDMLNPMIGDAAVGYFINSSTIVVRAYLSEQEREKASKTKYCKILINNTEKNGHITFLSRVADPNSGTFLAEIEIEEQNLEIVAGQNVIASLDLGEKKMHYLPQSVISLNSSGKLVIKTVDAQGVVQEYPAQVVDEDEGGIYAVGLPPKAKVLVFGQAYVKHGQKLQL